MKEKSLISVGFDFEGFGKSYGIRAYIRSLADLVSDMIDFIAFIEGRFPHLPLFYLGVSMGGLVGLYTLAH